MTEFQLVVWTLAAFFALFGLLMLWRAWRWPKRGRYNERARAAIKRARRERRDVMRQAKQRRRG